MDNIPSAIQWPPPIVTPEEIEARARQLVSRYSQAEGRLLNILREGNVTQWRRAFTIQQLSQCRAVLDTLGAETTQWVNYHIPTLYERGLAVADGYMMQPELVPLYKDLRKEGLGHFDAVRRMTLQGKPPGGLSVAAHPGEVTPLDTRFVRLHRESIQILSDNIVSSLGKARDYAGQWLEIMVRRAQLLRNDPASANAAWLAELNIRSASLQTLQDALLLGRTVTDAAADFLKDLNRRGITCFTDVKGRQWPMQRYSNMVVRTIQQETARHGTTNRLVEAGEDLAQITDHAEECPLCRVWERKIVSITGRTSGYPTITDAQKSGMFHPNCCHAVLPYIKARTL